MNIIRNIMAREVEELKEPLYAAYRAIEAYQRRPGPETERQMRETIAAATVRLSPFKPVIPHYKQAYITALEESAGQLSGSELLLLFDRAVYELHTRLEKRVAPEGATWTSRLKELLNVRRETASGPAEGEFLCAGSGASPGMARGPARVARELSDLAAMQVGEVIVCHMTTPDWMPYLTRAAAIVTDRGGTLSHAAIIAREIKIPCVVGTRNGTAVIRTGMQVEVNADLGIVTQLA